MVNDITEALMDLDMVPSGGRARTMPKMGWDWKWEAEGSGWMMLFVEVFGLLGYRFRRNGTGIQGTERKLKKGMGSLVEGLTHLLSWQCVVEDQVWKGWRVKFSALR